MQDLLKAEQKSNRCTAFVFHGAAKRSVPISLRLETVLRLLITAKETRFQTISLRRSVNTTASCDFSA